MGAILYGIGVNTHKELDSEVLMTLAPVISAGDSPEGPLKNQGNPA
jgi:hypothetical protein